jgi:HNH/ENDO VII superfamily nuclease with conserved GHE residues
MLSAAQVAFGHIPGGEFWREKSVAELEGLTHQEFSESMNDNFRIQVPTEAVHPR